MTAFKPIKVVLVGLGPHARNVHYPILEALRDAGMPLSVRLVIDLDDQRESVDAYLRCRSLQPTERLFLDPAQRGGGLARTAEARLDELRATGEVSHVLVCTEPRGHKPYILWAARNGIPVCTDKPLTAVDLSGFEPDAPSALVQDYRELEGAAARSGSTVVMFTPRRLHDGYTFVFDYLKAFVEKYEIPITTLHVAHGGGAMNLPHEYLEDDRENHPYRYGYGVLLHSGYHYADTFVRLATLGNAIPRLRPTNALISAHLVTPFDVVAQYGHESVYGLFGGDKSLFPRPDQVDSLRAAGETEISVLAQFRREETVLTSGFFSDCQSSVSKRDWIARPADWFAANGRVRQEQATMHVGHLTTVRVESFRAPASSDSERENDVTEKFVATVFRNPGLVGGPAREQFVWEERKHDPANDALARARRRMLESFLRDLPTGSEIASHAEVIRFMAGAYRAAFLRRRGLAGEAVVSLDVRSEP